MQELTIFNYEQKEALQIENKKRFQRQNFLTQ